MRIILKVSSSNEHCNGGCEFALLDLTPELARLAVGRIATLREQKSLDPDIDEVFYWAYFDEYFSPWKDPASPGEEVEGSGMTLEEMLDELAIEEKEIACVPETFQVPPHQIAAVECQQMVVRLSHRATETLRRAGSESGSVDALELPGDPAAGRNKSASRLNPFAVE
jgi:hypothetical protein